MAVKPSSRQGDEKGPGPSIITTGDGLTDSPSGVECNGTRLIVFGIVVMVAIPRDTTGGLSEREAVCGSSAESDSLGDRQQLSQLTERDRT